MRAAGRATSGCLPLTRPRGRERSPDGGQGVSHSGRHAQTRVGRGGAPKARVRPGGVPRPRAPTPPPRPSRPGRSWRHGSLLSRCQPVRSDAEPRDRHPSPPTVLSWAPMVAPRCARSVAAAETEGPPHPGPAPRSRHLGGGRDPAGSSPGAGAGGRARARPVRVRSREHFEWAPRLRRAARVRGRGRACLLCAFGCNAGLLWASFAAVKGGRWRPPSPQMRTKIKSGNSAAASRACRSRPCLAWPQKVRLSTWLGLRASCADSASLGPTSRPLNEPFRLSGPLFPAASGPPLLSAWASYHVFPLRKACPSIPSQAAPVVSLALTSEPKSSWPQPPPSQ